MTDVTIDVVRPRAGTRIDTTFSARDVAKAYSYPLVFTGKGFTCGIVELGGGFGQADLDAYFGALNLPTPNVTAVPVSGGKNQSDGPDGADGEVLLDIEVAGAVAPGAKYRVYFAPNTDAGFLAAIKQACAECDVVSISWGGPESAWDAATMDQFDGVFAKARQNGVIVFAASGDTGSRDGTSANVVDFPASSPNVIGCGGTKLTVNADGSRKAEVTWDDNDTQSATGGGVSAHFPGRQVPDVSGNASPSSGYEVRVDGNEYIIGGTSAVAPLYAGLVLLLSEALGQRLGRAVDFLNTILTNPTVCYDVTVGDNGGYKAGVGRDETTGFGVVDGERLLSVLTDTLADPKPAPAPTPTPEPTPTPTPTPAPPLPQPTRPDAADKRLADALKDWIRYPRWGLNSSRLKAAGQAWIKARGL